MSEYWALQSVVFLIPAILLFDRIRRRRLNYRRLWEMYEGLKGLKAR